MQHDFDTRIVGDRTSSAKWGVMYDHNPQLGSEIVPLSVADMEFPAPAPVVEALGDFLKNPFLGYTKPTQAFYDACIGWQRRRHGWEPDQDILVTSNGVVPAIYHAVRAYTQPGEGVIIQTPVYYPFSSAITANGRTLVENPLKLVEAENGSHRYEMDFEDLAAKAADPANRMLVLCSPHNPVGRVWSAVELRRLLDICLANDVLVVADEIHDDLIMPGLRHTAIMCVADPSEYDRLVVCTAPSKTFNLAGCQASVIYIPNAELRRRFQEERMALGDAGMLNAFGYVSTIAAYTQCDEWLDQLIPYIQGNYELLRGFVANCLPEVEVYPLEGTYLAWLDFRAWGLSDKDLDAFMEDQAYLFLDPGHLFGSAGSGFERVNLACPRSVLNAALDRLAIASRKLR